LLGRQIATLGLEVLHHGYEHPDLRVVAVNYPVYKFVLLGYVYKFHHLLVINISKRVRFYSETDLISMQGLRVQRHAGLQEVHPIYG